MHVLTLPFLIAAVYVLASCTVQTSALPMVYAINKPEQSDLSDMDDNILRHLSSLVNQKLRIGHAKTNNHYINGIHDDINNYVPNFNTDYENHLAAEHALAKREPKRYGFGLGRRSAGFAYTTSGSSGVKRLPVYNFGLGKRDEQEHDSMKNGYRPYVFGLGKRSTMFADRPEQVPQPNSVLEAPEEMSDSDMLRLAVLTSSLLNSNEDAPDSSHLTYSKDPYDYVTLDKEQSDVPVKREPVRAFNFGLGKRMPYLKAIDPIAASVDRRSPQSRYNFGLGR